MPSLQRIAAMSAVLVALALAATAEAKLGRTSIAKLSKQSDVIVVASPRKLLRSSPEHTMQAGSAELVVIETLRGKAPATISIAWGDEVHDQAIDRLMSRYVLFLKKGKGGVMEAAQYGRSFWPLQHLRGPGDQWDFAAFATGYPVGNVELDGTKLVRKADAYLEGTDAMTKVDVVFLKDLKAFVVTGK